jgi:hypothetical protein
MKDHDQHEGTETESAVDIARLMHAHAGKEPAFSGLQQRLSAIPDQYPRQQGNRLFTQLLQTLWPQNVVASWRVGRLAFMALLPMALGVSMGQVLPENSEALLVSTETEWYYLAFGDVASDITASDLAEMEAGVEAVAGEDLP